jgi:hypothetical protein
MLMTTDITPHVDEIRWNLLPVYREPTKPLIDHAIWWLRTARPGDADIDPVGNEAFWLIERLALALIDEERESAAKAEALRAELAFAHEQSKTIDKLRGYHEFIWPRPSPADFHASPSARSERRGGCGGPDDLASSAQ